MDEVLKALDQENERLYQDSRTQQDSPVSGVPLNWFTLVETTVYPHVLIYTLSFNINNVKKV